MRRLHLAGLLLAIVAMMVVGAPARAGDKDTRATINPSSFPVVDNDFQFNNLVEQPAAGVIEAMTAHDTATGSGVVVAVLDGGFNLNAPLIAGRISPLAYDAIDGDFDANDAGNGIDDDLDGWTDRAVGHGTFVSAMVLMAAPDATILPIRVVDDEGFAFPSEVVEGIEYATLMGADVINFSMEAAHHDDLIEDALELAENLGVTVVVSSGNDGMQDPAILPKKKYTLAVGAVDVTDTVSEFTPVAPWICVYAPGIDLWGPLGYPTDETVCFWSGNSFSTAIVSGAVALALEMDPTLQPEEVRNVIELAADPVYREDGTVVSGAGRINLREVIE